MYLPNDPIMLLSFINMQLRDTYPSIDELCAALNVNKSVLIEKLNGAGYIYNPETNTFIQNN